MLCPQSLCTGLQEQALSLCSDPAVCLPVGSVGAYSSVEAEVMI